MTRFVDTVRTLKRLVLMWHAPGALSLVTGVRTAAAVLVPLVVGQLADHAASGLMASIGGLNVALADVGGPYRVKAITMGVALVGTATAGFLGTIVGGLSWFGLPLVFLFACAAGLAGVFGNAAAKVSFVSLVLFVLMVAMPAGLVDSLGRYAAFIGGGLWAMVLSLWLWPLYPYQPIREAVAACYQAICTFMRVAVQAGAGQGTAGLRWTVSAIPERAAVISAIEQARSMVVAARSARAGMSPVGQGLLVQVRGADALFDAIIALAEVREAASQHAGENQLGAEVDRVVPELIGSMKALAVAIAQQHDHLDLAALDQAMAAVSKKALELTQSLPPHAVDETVSLDLQSIAGALQRAGARVHAAADTLTQHGERHTVAPPPMLGSPSRPARLQTVINLLRNNFTLQSLAFRHALRLGLTTTAAVALYAGLGLPHGAWVTLTVVAILKPNFGGTYQQAIQRVSGTVAGSIVGALLAAAVIKLLFLDLLLIPLGILAFSIMAWHYGLGVLFLTSFVLVLLNTVQPGHWDFAVIRSLDTMIGGLLALLAGYLLWPSWERQRLPAQLARTITANLAYFRIVMSGYLGQPAERATLQAQRAQAQVENTNAAAAFQRLLSEPIVQHGPVAPAYSLVTYNQRLYDSITSLAVAQALGNGPRLLPGVDTFSTQVERVLQDLAQALRTGVRPTALPSFDASLSALHAHIRELVSEGMTTAPVGHSDQRHSRVIQDLAVLSSALDRLADEVIELAKAVEHAESRGTNAVQDGAFIHSSA